VIDLMHTTKLGKEVVDWANLSVNHQNNSPQQDSNVIRCWTPTIAIGAHLYVEHVVDTAVVLDGCGWGLVGEATGKPRRPQSEEQQAGQEKHNNKKQQPPKKEESTTAGLEPAPGFPEWLSRPPP
jgi:hypothetical protein